MHDNANIAFQVNICCCITGSSPFHPLHKHLPQLLPNSGCYWPCRNPCLLDVEVATQSLSLFLTKS
jgi:hypothetical protein